MPFWKIWILEDLHVMCCSIPCNAKNSVALLYFKNLQREDAQCHI